MKWIKNPTSIAFGYCFSLIIKNTIGITVGYDAVILMKIKNKNLNRKEKINIFKRKINILHY